MHLRYSQWFPINVYSNQHAVNTHYIPTFRSNQDLWQRQRGRKRFYCTDLHTWRFRKHTRLPPLMDQIHCAAAQEPRRQANRQRPAMRYYKGTNNALMKEISWFNRNEYPFWQTGGPTRNEILYESNQVIGHQGIWTYMALSAAVRHSWGLLVLAYSVICTYDSNKGKTITCIFF